MAHARKQVDHRYRYEQVWSAAVRMVRVDLRFPVHEQDEATGFVLFDWVENNRPYPGSIELVRTEVDGVPQVRVVVQVPSMPTYVEQMLVDRLARKLEDEFGQPPPPPRREPPRAERPPEDDDGADRDCGDGDADRDRARDGNHDRNGNGNRRREGTQRPQR